MSMLDRYRKTGGFHQLLALLETCGAQKQEKFLEIIRTEDPRWADAIRAKMLDMNRIYGWNDETLAEIVGTLQDLTLAIALHAAQADIRERILKMLTSGRKRKIDDLFGTTNPSPGEVATMHMKIIETVRKMAHDGFLRFEKFDPALQIDEGIEEKLNKPAPTAAAPAAATGSAMFKIEYDEGANAAATESSSDSGTSSLELASLKKKMADLSKENAVLRHELSVARGKLDQIKKIA